MTSEIICKFKREKKKIILYVTCMLVTEQNWIKGNINDIREIKKIDLMIRMRVLFVQFAVLCRDRIVGLDWSLSN